MTWSEWFEIGEGHYAPEMNVGMAEALTVVSDTYPIDENTSVFRQGGGVQHHPTGSVSTADIWDEIRADYAANDLRNSDTGDPGAIYAASHSDGVGTAMDVIILGGSAYDVGLADIRQHFRTASFVEPDLPTDPESALGTTYLTAFAGLEKDVQYLLIPGTSEYVQYETSDATFLNWRYVTTMHFGINHYAHVGGDDIDQDPEPTTLQLDLSVVSLSEYAAWVNTHLALPNENLGVFVESVVGTTGESLYNKVIDPLPGGQDLGYMWRMPTLPPEYDPLDGNEAMFASVDVNEGANRTPGLLSSERGVTPPGLSINATLPRYRYWKPQGDLVDPVIDGDLRLTGARFDSA